MPVSGDTHFIVLLADATETTALSNAREALDRESGICTDREMLWSAFGRSVKEARMLLPRDELGCIS